MLKIGWKDCACVGLTTIDNIFGCNLVHGVMEAPSHGSYDVKQI